MKMNLMLFIGILLLLEGKNTDASSVPDLNAGCYGKPGDINLALLSGFSDRGVDQLCSLEPQPWQSLFFQFYQGFTFAIETINNSSDLLPNITLGYIIMDTCWRDLAALGQTVQLLDIHDTKFANRREHLELEGPNGTSMIRNIANKTTPAWKTNVFTCPRDQLDLDVVGVVGPGSSAESVMVAGLASVVKVPVLATLATSDELSDKSRFEFFTRMVSPDKFQVEAILKFMTHFNWTYASLVYSEGVYGENAAKMIVKDTRRLGICLQVSEIIPTDISRTVAEETVHKLIRHPKARIIIAFIQQSQISMILEEMTEKGFEKYFIWLTGDSLADSNLGEAADGAFVVNYRVNSVPEFNEYYLNLTPSQIPKDPWIRYLWQMFYDCSWEEGGGKTSCSAYSHVPYKDQYTSSSVSLYIDGVFTYAHAMDALVKAYCPLAFKDKSKLAGCLTGPLLLSYLRNTSFEGYSGKVSFDEQGDRLGKYHIKQYRANSKSAHQIVTEFDKQSDYFAVFEGEIDWSMFRRDSGENKDPMPSVCSEPCKKKEYAVIGELRCCWECRKCRSNEILVVNGTFESCAECPARTWPDDAEGTTCEEIEADFLHWDSVATIILCTIGLFLLATTLITITWIIRNRNITLLKASSRHLSIVILVGIALAVGTSILMLSTPTDAVCQASTVGFHISVAVIFVPLLTKTARIYRIFSCSLRGITTPTMISNRSVNSLTAGLIFLQVALILVSATISPTLAKVEMPVRTERVVEQFCDVQLTGLLLVLTFNLIIILACAVLGFLTRHLPENFNESWYIFVAVSATLFSWLVFLPTYFTTKNAIYRVILLVSSLLMNSLVTLVCFFLPKVYAIYFYDENLLKYAQSGALAPSVQPKMPTLSSQIRHINLAPTTSRVNNLDDKLVPDNSYSEHQNKENAGYPADHNESHKGINIEGESENCA